MGPAIRPFAYRRDPWWDPDGRVTRRRRRRRLVAWAVLVALAVTLGGIVGETRAAAPDAPTAHGAVTATR